MGVSALEAIVRLFSRADYPHYNFTNILKPYLLWAQKPPKAQISIKGSVGITLKLALKHDMTKNNI